jgi:hypothetical protein
MAMVTAAACSSSAASSPSPSQPTALGFTAAGLCALVTQADVSAAIGSPVGPGVPSGVNAPSCGWQDSKADGATIAATDPASVGQVPYALQNMPGPHVTAVSGVGDAAFFASGATGATAELDVRKGGRAITITVGSVDPSYTQAQQEAAELVIGTAAARNM